MPFQRSQARVLADRLAEPRRFIQVVAGAAPGRRESICACESTRSGFVAPAQAGA